MRRCATLVFTFGLLAAACSKQGGQQIIFGPKVFSDLGEWVYATGSLTGDGVPNNSVVVICEKQRMECITCSVYQIGDNQIGRPDGPDIYPVMKWDSREIIATQSDELNCLKTTISIERNSQWSGTVVWVEEPINQASTHCKEHADLIRKAGLSPQRLRKFTIEDSSAWKRIHTEPQSPAAAEPQSPPQVSSKTKAVINFDLQERCAKQAREQFKQLGWDKEGMAGFTNHYNEEMNKCLVLIQNTDAKSSPGTIWTNIVLLDAFEGKELGTYLWHTMKDKKYWEVPPFQCEVTLPSGEKKTCNSQAEFDELIKIYME